MKCPKCHFENNEDSSFCRNCGSPLHLKKVCPHCEKEIDGDSRFCPFCGSLLDEVSQPSQGKEPSQAKEKTRKIISKVLSISTLVFFACSLVFGLGNYLSHVNGLNNASANIITLFGVLNDFFTPESPSTIAGQIHNIAGPYQGTYLVLVALFYYGALISICVLGIVKEAQNLNANDGEGNNPYLPLLVSSSSFSYALLSNGLSFGGGSVAIGGGLGSILVIGGILFLLRLANSLVFSFAKGKGLTLASNIVNSILFIQFIAMIGKVGSGYLSFGGTSNEGTYGFISILSYLESSLPILDATIEKVNYGLGVGLAFATVECLVYIAFALFAFFCIKSLSKGKLDKSTIVFSSLAFALAFIYMALGIAEGLILASTLNVSVHACSGLTSTFVKAFFFLGGSIVSYILQKKSLALPK